MNTRKTAKSLKEFHNNLFWENFWSIFEIILDESLIIPGGDSWNIYWKSLKKFTNHFLEKCLADLFEESWKAYVIVFVLAIFSRAFSRICICVVEKSFGRITGVNPAWTSRRISSGLHGNCLRNCQKKKFRQNFWRNF